MLSKKYDSKLAGEPTIAAAFEKAKPGKMVSAGGQWYWIAEDKKELIKNSDFEFLTIDSNGEPWESFVSYNKGNGEWKANAENITKELGNMGDMIPELERIEKRFLEDQQVINSVEALPKFQELQKKAPHIKLTRLQFSVFDVDLEKPVWRAEFKNWPLISYLKRREITKTVNIIIDAIEGKIISFKESDE